MYIVILLFASLPLVYFILYILFLKRKNAPFAKFLANSFFYTGRVTHTRLKGGSIHHLDYPIFFAYLNLSELIKSYKNDLWPFFSVDLGWKSLTSFDGKYHLKDYKSNSTNFQEKLNQFITEKSKGLLNMDNMDVFILTHLTYLGYCFNPVSFYFIQDKASLELKAIIAEVSNTPWNEQHSYFLHPSIEGVYFSKSKDSIHVEWDKCFHVSPFMEMDYRYAFTFSNPGRETLWVKSKMLKKSDGTVWFTANFTLNKLGFTIGNIIYLLAIYPIHTRIIQLWIHIEALKLFSKGVAMFEHPLGHDVDFGWGITGKRLGNFLWYLTLPIYSLLGLFKSFSPSKEKIN